MKPLTNNELCKQLIGKNYSEKGTNSDFYAKAKEEGWEFDECCEGWVKWEKEEVKKKRVLKDFRRGADGLYAIYDDGSVVQV